MSDDNQSKPCLVVGCTAPRYKYHPRCEAHHREHTRASRKGRFAKMTDEQREGYNAYQRRYQKKRRQNLTDEQRREWNIYQQSYKRERRGFCSVDGCNEPRYGKSVYCRDHHKAQKTTLRTPALNPQKRGLSGASAEKRHLLVIYTNRAKYAQFIRVRVVENNTVKSPEFMVICEDGQWVEYQLVRHCEAKSEKSLQAVLDLTLRRPDWHVVEVDDVALSE